MNKKEIFLTLLQVVFNATVGSSYKGDIAIDDVSFKPGFCLSGKLRYRYISLVLALVDNF